MSAIKKCILCNKEYEVCSKRLSMATYLYNFCGIKHSIIFEILNDYCNKKIEIEEAKSKLIKCNIFESNYENFQDNYVKLIDKILNYNIKKNESLILDDSKEEVVNKENIKEKKTAKKITYKGKGIN